MALTPAQLTTWKTDIASNANETPQYPGVAISALSLTNSDHADAIAKWYSLQASPDYFVWRDVPMATVLNTITFANMTPLDAIPLVTALGSNPSVAANATFNNQMATVHQWNGRSLSCQGKQFNLQNLTIGRDTAPMKNITYRAALQDCLTNIPAGASGALLSANWVGVRDGAKFLANRIEELLATGAGTTATPSDLGYEGSVTYQDLQA